jgi:hypothetical protein
MVQLAQYRADGVVYRNTKPVTVMATMDCVNCSAEVLYRASRKRPLVRGRVRHGTRMPFLERLCIVSRQLSAEAFFLQLEECRCRRVEASIVAI